MEKLAELTSTKAVLGQAFNYYRNNFASFFRFTLMTFLPLLFLTGIQIIIYALKVNDITSFILLDILSFLFSILTLTISQFTEPTIYLILIILGLQILTNKDANFDTISKLFQKHSFNFAKTFVIFFLYFITVQQLVHLLLLTPLSFSTIQQSIDLETLIFAENLNDKINSIYLDKIIYKLYPITYYFTEIISIIIAAFFVKKYYLYIPITIVENVTNTIPLKNSKLLVNEVKPLVNKLFFLTLFLPYFINASLTITFTNLLGLDTTLSMMIANLGAAKQISLFISALINSFIYPILALSMILVYLKAREALGESPTQVLETYQKS